MRDLLCFVGILFLSVACSNETPHTGGVSGDATHSKNPFHCYTPSKARVYNGLVPSEAVAARIADAIWSSKYDQGLQRPCGYMARLVDSSYWKVYGLYPGYSAPGHMGGGPELKIKADSGTVFDMYISL